MEYAIAEDLSTSTPEKAFEYFQNIQTVPGDDQQDRRNKVLQIILERIAYFDPVRAEALLANSGVPENVQDRLRKAIRETSPQ